MEYKVWEQRSTGRLLSETLFITPVELEDEVPVTIEALNEFAQYQLHLFETGAYEEMYQLFSDVIPLLQEEKFQMPCDTDHTFITESMLRILWPLNDRLSSPPFPHEQIIYVFLCAWTYHVPMEGISPFISTNYVPILLEACLAPGSAVPELPYDLFAMQTLTNVLESAPDIVVPCITEHEILQRLTSYVADVNTNVESPEARYGKLARAASLSITVITSVRKVLPVTGGNFDGFGDLWHEWMEVMTDRRHVREGVSPVAAWHPKYFELMELFLLTADAIWQLPWTAYSNILLQYFDVFDPQTVTIPDEHICVYYEHLGLLLKLIERVNKEIDSYPEYGLSVQISKCNIRGFIAALNGEKCSIKVRRTALKVLNLAIQKDPEDGDLEAFFQEDWMDMLSNLAVMGQAAVKVEVIEHLRIVIDAYDSEKIVTLFMKSRLPGEFGVMIFDGVNMTAVNNILQIFTSVLWRARDLRILERVVNALDDMDFWSGLEELLEGDFDEVDPEQVEELLRMRDPIPDMIEEQNAEREKLNKGANEDLAAAEEQEAEMDVAAEEQEAEMDVQLEFEFEPWEEEQDFL